MIHKYANYLNNQVAKYQKKLYDLLYTTLRAETLNGINILVRLIFLLYGFR